ncbi:MAG: cell division protein FtsZ, partial [Pseudomonadota bacterium]
LTLFELDEAANRIREEVDPDANIIVGSTLDTDMDGMMRVSVVATGIDAATDKGEMPVPRRSLASPLKNSVTVEETRSETEATDPAVEAAASMQATEPAPAPAEPSFFAQIDETQETAKADKEDGLPPPAYTPEPAPEAAQFVAPTAPAPGTPTPEVMARLHAAVRKEPNDSDADAGAEEGGDRARFGINSLINRMTGQAGDPRSPSGRPLPPAQTAIEEQLEEDPEMDRIEIPAFLRRQAN